VLATVGISKIDVLLMDINLPGMDSAGATWISPISRCGTV